MSAPRPSIGLPIPRSREEVEDAATVAGMRRAIEKAAGNSSVIQHCFEVAESQRLNREEIYVLLAYQALLRLEKLHQAHQHLKQLWTVDQAADSDGHF